MANITEKTGNGELVTNRDQLVVVDNIEPLIKIIRGQQVMLNRDLATLYGVETKRLNEQVKRNISETGNLGRVVDIVDRETGEIIPSYISIDRKTNEITDIPAYTGYIFT